jgi:hypothetical protein
MSRNRVILAAAFSCVLGLSVSRAEPVAAPGSVQLKGADFASSQPYALQLNLDAEALTFLALDAGGTPYSGHLARKGRQGHKLSFFLDIGSSEAFAADVAARAAAVSGRSAGAVLGQSSKLVLSAKEDGSASLKIKGEVLVDGVGAVAFRANLAASASVAPTPPGTLARTIDEEAAALAALQAKRNLLFEMISATIEKFNESAQQVQNQIGR